MKISTALQFFFEFYGLVNNFMENILLRNDVLPKMDGAENAEVDRAVWIIDCSLPPAGAIMLRAL